jgi:ABC-2 type transport system ATP-binding protein
VTGDIALRDVTLRYGRTIAVDRVTLDLPAGRIYGLSGRNGAGKSSLLALLAAYLRPTSGTVTVGGVDPFENAELMQRSCLVRDDPDVTGNTRVGRALALAAELRRSWDADYAGRLADTFELAPRRRVAELSRGQRSALGAVLGLASRAPLTMLDEPTLGMDAVTRAALHRELLTDYLAHPRTIIVATHLIEEAADLFEQVLVVDLGRLVLHDDTDVLRSAGVAVTGTADAVEGFVAGRAVLDRQELGHTRRVTLYAHLDEDERATARRAGLTLSPVGLQDLLVHLAGRTTVAVGSREAHR